MLISCCHCAATVLVQGGRGQIHCLRYPGRRGECEGHDPNQASKYIMLYKITLLTRTFPNGANHRDLRCGLLAP